jgi:DNA-binding HxlR family transcriptional regulator
MSVSERDESPEVCFTVRHVLDRVGDKWSTLVIAELGNSTLRFGELRRQVEGISQRMLTVTLRNLERDGLISRRVYPQIPPRVEYTLTDLGRSLLASIVGLVDWSTQHTADIQAARSDFDSRDLVTET